MGTGGLQVKVDCIHPGCRSAREVRWKEKVLRPEDDGHPDLSHTVSLLDLHQISSNAGQQNASTGSLGQLSLVLWH